MEQVGVEWNGFEWLRKLFGGTVSQWLFDSATWPTDLGSVRTCHHPTDGAADARDDKPLECFLLASPNYNPPPNNYGSVPSGYAAAGNYPGQGTSAGHVNAGMNNPWGANPNYANGP